MPQTTLAYPAAAAEVVAAAGAEVPPGRALAAGATATTPPRRQLAITIAFPCRHRRQHRTANAKGVPLCRLPHLLASSRPHRNSSNNRTLSANSLLPPANNNNNNRAPRWATTYLKTMRRHRSAPARSRRRQGTRAEAAMAPTLWGEVAAPSLPPHPLQRLHRPMRRTTRALGAPTKTQAALEPVAAAVLEAEASAAGHCLLTPQIVSFT